MLLGGGVMWSRRLLISWETGKVSKEAENRHSDNLAPPSRLHLP